jgi:phage terminase large subunit-like protein
VDDDKHLHQKPTLPETSKQIKPNHRKIDGAVATIMALDRAIRCGNTNSASVYDERGILFI